MTDLIRRPGSSRPGQAAWLWVMIVLLLLVTWLGTRGLDPPRLAKKPTAS